MPAQSGRLNDRFGAYQQPKYQRRTIAYRPEVTNDELDFMGEGFSPSIPEEVERSCNETL